MTNAWPLPETGKHTELPWAATTRQGSWDWVVYSASKPHLEICQPFHDGTEDNPTGEANAALIVRAVNAHEGLVKALEEAQGLLRFIRRGIARKKIKDVSVVPPVPPGAKELDLTSLSAMIDAALKQSESTL